MASTDDTLGRLKSAPDPGTITPEEETEVEAQLARVRDEKARALRDPGPSWREWFLYHAAKWYLGLAFLIVLAWEIGYLLPPSSVTPDVVLPLVVGTVYAMFLAYQILWHRPSAGPSRSARHRSRSRLLRPVAFGRWTPEAAAARAGLVLPPPETGPDPREFL